MPDIKHFDPDAALERVERLFWQHGSDKASIQAVATATGLSRSSLYTTFGDKRELYLAALRRYLLHRAQPAFRELGEDGRGLPAVRDFFAGLIEARCSGEYAGWGCMVVNAHIGPEGGDPAVRALLDEHHRLLRDALRTEVEIAGRQGQLAPGVSPDAAAETLALLAYGVNLRSRGGADAETLLGTVQAALALLGRREHGR
ncbi:TetR/AcrR family transcriptional regulator [Streptomyces sp. RKAG337]|uniref:TetR/AcrR family transcriptional regulator n=1 Tax=Streptomyces sp. RKAG337 TaxID=2893404 RepID=UPI0020346BDA|nr:TetR/AcrR family transcriptional regulator [Streptomyces sp. RKAG337]MCM2429980.1 TetR/AcrR family transcriptional regulator [Streptomyces sp. RKAG337]